MADVLICSCRIPPPPGFLKPEETLPPPGGSSFSAPFFPASPTWLPPPRDPLNRDSGHLGQKLHPWVVFRVFFTSKFRLKMLTRMDLGFFLPFFGYPDPGGGTASTFFFPASTFSQPAHGTPLGDPSESSCTQQLSQWYDCGGRLDQWQSNKFLAIAIAHPQHCKFLNYLASTKCFAEL